MYRDPNIKSASAIQVNKVQTQPPPAQATVQRLLKCALSLLTTRQKSLIRILSQQSLHGDHHRALAAVRGVMRTITQHVDIAVNIVRERQRFPESASSVLSPVHSPTHLDHLVEFQRHSYFNLHYIQLHHELSLDKSCHKHRHKYTY